MNAHIINKVSNDTIDEAEISIVYRQVASGGGGGGFFRSIHFPYFTYRKLKYIVEFSFHVFGAYIKIELKMTKLTLELRFGF